MYISNNDSKHLHPGNTSTNFTVQLPRHLELNSEEWECGVVHCVLSAKPEKPLYITCDFVQPSILGGQLQPVLCSMSAKTKAFEHITMISLSRGNLSSLHVKIVNTRGIQIALKGETTYIVLEFRKKYECKSMDHPF